MFSNVYLNGWVVVLWYINKGQRVKTDTKVSKTPQNQMCFLLEDSWEMLLTKT